MKAFSSRQVFRFTFASICMVCVAGMIYYWVYKFLVDDRDIGSVDYEDVPESEMKLPVGSICVQDPFLENKQETRSLIQDFRQRNIKNRERTQTINLCKYVYLVTNPQILIKMNKNMYAIKK